ncbi:MAG: IS630 transposase-related protein [Thermoguttaceae bacterium]|nr:IS630 transposase-related protein [Thermoguttaceae bacterium]
MAFKEGGATFKQLKAVFGIDRKTHNAWVKLLHETGSVIPEQVFLSRQRKINKEALRKAVEKKPDAYLSELTSLFQCSIPAVFYALKKMGIALKKKTFAYAEKSEEKRAKFVKDVAQIPKEKRVYMDDVAWINA